RLLKLIHTWLMRESRQPGPLNAHLNAHLNAQGGMKKGFQGNPSSGLSGTTAFDYKPQRARTNSHARWFVSGLVLPLLAGILAYAMAHRYNAFTAPKPAILDNLPPIEIEKLAIPTVLPPSLLGDTVEFVVRRNDTMDRIFRQLKLNLTDLASIRDVPGVQ